VFNHVLKHKSFTGAASLEYMELNFSNICNLKCKMCGNDRSSKWSSDAEAMGFPVYGKLFSDVHLSDYIMRTLRFIRILGGEPLLHEDQIIDMLTRAENLGTIDRLTLGITTNGTMLPNAKLLPLLQKCQNIFWTISIDAAYQLNDYIRSGSDWNVITSNLLELERLSNATGTWSINVGSVCMIYNANRMHELADWIDAHIPSLQGRHSWFPLHFPEYLAADRLPSDYLLELADRYDKLAAERPGWRADSWWRPIAMHLRSSANKVPYIQDRNDYYAAFARDSKQLITQLDRLRGDDLFVANPEIHHQPHRNNPLANP
jgi:pyruvate-formate lyase-activating enzyme